MLTQTSDLLGFGLVHSVYLACAADDRIRFISSSGGFCKSFLCYLLDARAVDQVILTRTGPPTSPLVPETIITNSKEDIVSSRTNSIYASTNPLAIPLLPGHTYALVGLGCHIRSVTSQQKEGRLRNVVVKIGLLCHHTPVSAFTAQILRRLSIREDEVVQIEYRGNGWPGGFTAYLVDGTRRFLPTDAYWTNDLGNALDKCRECAEVAETADIVACDPWNLGLETIDRLGQTLVLCRNENMDILVNEACRTGFLRLHRCDRNVLMRSQGRHIAEKRARRR